MISEKAFELLEEATKDKHGIILKSDRVGGMQISTNGKNFIEKDNPRSEALWSSALKELEYAGCVEERGMKKGTMYYVTNKGFLLFPE